MRAFKMMRSATSFVALAFLLLTSVVVVVVFVDASGVEKQPLQGQGMPAPEDKPIYVSSMLERLLDVNGKMYRFETLQWVYLSWTDERARQKVIGEVSLVATTLTSVHAHMHHNKLTINKSFSHLPETNVRLD